MSSARTITNLNDMMDQEQRTTASETWSPLGDTSDSSSPPPTSISSHSQTTTTSNTSPPSTPPRGRSSSRYPSSLGRVPLHRRGTSKTYERLEDLLREAGYKETRVFTPEAERLESEADNGKRNGGRVTASGSVRDGVGAVVGFIAGLVSRNTSLAREALPQTHLQGGYDIPEWSRPSSPLLSSNTGAGTYMNATPAPAPLSLYSSYNTSSESLQSYSHLTTPKAQPSAPSRPNTPSRLLNQHHNNVHSQRPPLASAHSPAHLRQPHRTLSSYGNPAGTSARPSNARAYLRHMASAPNIQPPHLSKRNSNASLATTHRQSYKVPARSSRRTIVLNASDVEEAHEYGGSLTQNSDETEPPMPRNWLENVARSILFGGAGTHIGGPSTAAACGDGHTTYPARMASALSDHTNVHRIARDDASLTVKPPFLCAQVDRRGRTSQGTVVCTRVTCQSAPASRTGSRTREGNMSPGSKRAGKGKKTSRNVGGKGKRKEIDGVPSLARTKVENDGWNPRNRYISGWGIDADLGNERQAISSDENDDDEDEDDGELDLDRILVPARRQHSIRSLRKHLQKSNATSKGLLGLSCPASRQNRLTSGDTTDGGEEEEWGKRSWGAGRGRRWIVGEEDEGDGYGYGVDGFAQSETGTRTRAGTRKRKEIPWAQ